MKVDYANVTKYQQLVICDTLERAGQHKFLPDSLSPWTWELHLPGGQA
jgi:hypothetical protein